MVFQTLVDKFIRAGGSQIDTLKVYNTLGTPSSGDTFWRPYAPKPGSSYTITMTSRPLSAWMVMVQKPVDNTTTAGRAIISSGYDSGTNLSCTI